jgi:hypothetical protein
MPYAERINPTFAVGGLKKIFFGSGDSVKAVFPSKTAVVKTYPLEQSEKHMLS